MENILIHPESNEQLETVKAVLKALKVRFEIQRTVLPSHVIKSAKRVYRNMKVVILFHWMSLPASIS